MKLFKQNLCAFGLFYYAYTQAFKPGIKGEVGSNYLLRLRRISRDTPAFKTVSASLLVFFISSAFAMQDQKPAPDSKAGTEKKEHKDTLRNAVKDQDVEIVRTLLLAKAHPNECDKNGCSLLWHAAYRDSHEIVNLLLDAKADPNMQDDDGEAPLYKAVTNNNPGIVKILLDAGAKVGTLDKDNETALELAKRAKWELIDQEDELSIRPRNKKKTRTQMKKDNAEIIKLLNSYGEAQAKKAYDELDSDLQKESQSSKKKKQKKRKKIKKPKKSQNELVQKLQAQLLNRTSILESFTYHSYLQKKLQAAQSESAYGMPVI